MTVDVNGTRFHLVLGEQEWLAVGAPPGDVAWTAGAVQLRRALPEFPARKERPPSLDDRRGAARDRYGNWYWIGDDAREIRVLPVGTRQGMSFWSARDGVPPGDAAQTGGAFVIAAPGVPDRERTLSGAAVTSDHYLVVGERKPNGLLAFDLYGGGGPLELPWPADVPFAPFDLSPTNDGGMWVLDRDNRALWRLDRQFRVVSPVPLEAPTHDFAPVVTAPIDRRPRALACDTRRVTWSAARPMPMVGGPAAVEALPDGSVLVLDNPIDSGASASVILRFTAAHDAWQQVALDAGVARDDAVGVDDGGRLPLPLRGHDIAFVDSATQPRRAVAGTLYVVTPSGNQAIAFSLDARAGTLLLRMRPDYLPMRRFTGKGLASAGVQPYYDSAERWLPLVEQPNPRFATAGELSLPATTDPDWFDGREPRCVWHRLAFDGCIPAGARVAVYARAADDATLLPDQPWQEQPLPYRRGDGSELPYYEPTPAGARDDAGTWEFLFQGTVGRYLQLRVALSGNGRVSPRMQSLRIHYPRFSYLREYLPAAYREEPSSASFLDRFLANVEGTYTTIEGRIAEAQELVDVRTIPGRYLDWLASWFGATLDLGWSERTKRLFIAHAPQIYRERGTCAGLVRSLRLALDACADERLFADSPCDGNASTGGFDVRVVEGWRTRRAAGVVAGDPTRLLGAGSTANASSWTPAQGAEPLHQQWRAFLARRYASAEALAAAWGIAVPAEGFRDSSIRLPAVRPSVGARRDDWLWFLRREIGFTYAEVADADEPLYREFLAHRYAQPADVNTAYERSGAAALGTFADVRARLWDPVLARTLPPSGAWLEDWMLFVSTVLPLERSAHRFVVLVPVSADELPEDQLRKRAVAERVARLEKPAHTSFEVRLYWGMFRVGEARLGLDSVLGPGSRSVAIVLDRAVLGGGHLGFPDAARARGNMVVGQERAGAPRTLARCTCA